MNIKGILIFVGLVIVIFSFGAITGIGTYYMGTWIMNRYSYIEWLLYTWGSGIALAVISIVMVLRIIKSVSGEA